MNKYLKSASERFEKIRGKEHLINPISEIDCEIVIELGQILMKAGLKDVCEILKNYKYSKDKEVRDNLLQWNIDHPILKSGIANLVDKVAQDIVDEDKDAKKKCPFLKIGDLRLKVYDLLGFELYERMEEGSDFALYKYGILINPTPDHAKQIPAYSN